MTVRRERASALAISRSESRVGGGVGVGVGGGVGGGGGGGVGGGSGVGGGLNKTWSGRGQRELIVTNPRGKDLQW